MPKKPSNPPQAMLFDETPSEDEGLFGNKPYTAPLKGGTTSLDGSLFGGKVPN